MVEETESPRLFHLWSAITGAAAALGRRCFFQLGSITVYPHHYTLLVGTPASRKSTAISMMAKQLRKSTSVRVGPSDSGGKGDRKSVVLGKSVLAAVDAGGRRISKKKNNRSPRGHKQQT